MLYDPAWEEPTYINGNAISNGILNPSTYINGVLESNTELAPTYTCTDPINEQNNTSCVEHFGISALE